MNQKLHTAFGDSKIYSSPAPNSKPRVMIVPGYSESVTHNKPLVKALYRQGFDAFTFSQPRRNGKGSVSGCIARQGEVVLSVLEGVVPAGDQVHVAAHSFGAAAVLKAARMAPKRFASLTLLQPVGMEGDQTIPQLIGRVSKKATHNQIAAARSQKPHGQTESRYTASVDTASAARLSGRVARSQLAGGGVLAKQPILAFKEAIAVGRYDIVEDVALVKKQGVPINIVKAHGDEIFGTDQVDTGYARIATIDDSYSSVADRTAGHDTFWMHPERTARIISQLISR